MLVASSLLLSSSVSIQLDNPKLLSTLVALTVCAAAPYTVRSDGCREDA